MLKFHNIEILAVWMELETVRLSEISQSVKDKRHMISPIGGI